jgi:hypothetical protein
MKTSTQNRSLTASLCDWLPDELCDEAEQVGALTALCFGRGALFLQAQSRRGIAVERIGEIQFHEIIPNSLTKQDIERLALRVGHDAAMAFLLRRVLEDGGDLAIPDIDALARKVMR